jgi:hypothetical protein
LPYAQLGGLPIRHPELPILVVTLAIYCTAWLYGLCIVVQAYRRGHSNKIAIILFLVCGERIIAYMMRIVWLYRISDVRIAVAAQILLQAGVILTYVATLLSAASLLRAHFISLPWLTPLLVTLSIITVTSFAANLFSTILSVYTMQGHIQQICRDVQRAVATYLVFLTCIPVLMLVAIRYFQRTHYEIPKNHSRKEVSVVILSASVACLLMASFRAGIVLKDPSPLFSPAWYLSLACLYCFELGPELLVTLSLLVMTARCMDSK